MNFRQFASLLILPLALSTGCGGHKTEPLPASTPAVVVSAAPEVSPVTEISPPTTPRPQTPTDEPESADGDEDSNLEDMYVRIYGEDSVIMDGNKPEFDTRGFSQRISGMKPGDLQNKINQTLKEAENLEKQGGESLPAAAGLYRQAEMMAKAGKTDTSPVSGKISKLGNQARAMLLELVKNKKFKEAIIWADTAVICNPSDSVVLESAGDVFSETGEEGLAKAFFSEALLLNPANTKLRYKLKNMYILEGDFEKAIPLIDTKTAAFGRTKSVNDELAQAYLGIYLKQSSKRHQMESLIRENLGKAIKNTAHIPTSCTELEMNLALFNEKYDKAAQLCRKMLKMDYPRPIKTRLIYNLALLEYLKGSKNECISHLKDVISRVMDGNSPTQGENYMAQMSLWFLDAIGEEPYTAEKARKIYSMAKQADHSYRQEYGFISGYLQSKEDKNYFEAAEYLEKYTQKRHLEPVGDFAQDLLQVPAQKSLIYNSLADLYNKTGKTEKSEKLIKEVRTSKFNLKPL